MIRQRVNAGLKRTVAQGKQFGRPRIDAALEKRIQAQLRTGKGMLKVARECGVGSGTVQRIRQEMEGPFVGEADGAQMKLKRPSTRCPLYPQKRTLILQPRMSALCRYCCKSLQTLGDDFFG